MTATEGQRGTRLVRMRAHKRWVRRRLLQLGRIVVCSLLGHDYSQWRRETEDWFEYVDGPWLFAHRVCHHCQLIEQVCAAEPAKVTETWRLIRACLSAGGHLWEPADAMIAWRCKRCPAERDGMPKDGT